MNGRFHKVIVLDYNTQSVVVELIPHDQDILDGLSALEYNLDNINWMVVKDDESVPVYFCDADKPFAYL